MGYLVTTKGGEVMSNRNERLSEVEGIDRSKLHRALSNAFNEAEIKLLCSDLNIEFEDIQGDQKGVTALNLIQYCERHGRIPALVDHILERRAHISREYLLVVGAHPAPDLPANFEFVNRAYELDLICKPGAPRFILVDGAAGYGKTYLLHKVKEFYESNEREAWKTAYIDLKHDEEIRSEDSNLVRPRIANAIVQQFRSSLSNIQPFSFGADEEDIINDLVTFLNELNADILLLLDSIEILPRLTAAWLKNLVYELDQGLRNGQQNLRVVFSGRYVSDWGRGASYPLKTISLSSFDRVVVREMIDGRAKVRKKQPRTQYLEELTWQVLYLSGGHPQGICDVLDKITNAGFISRNIERTLFRRQFRENGHEGTLFQICIEPIIQTLLSGLSDPLADVFKKLSPIRRFDPEILDDFLQAGLIVAPKYTSSWDLIRDMLRTHLINPPNASERMFSDQIVRRMLAMQLMLSDIDLFNEINANAQRVFHERACKQQPSNTEVWHIAVIESLYHTLQLASRKEPASELRTILIKKLQTYIETTRDPRDLLQLKGTLAQDVELNDLLDRHTGDNTMQILLDLIEDRIRTELFGEGGSHEQAKH